MQLYEAIFVALLGFVLSSKADLPDGARFRIFLCGYLAWRLAIDFLKPQPLVAGLNLIQWASAAGILILGTTFVVDLRIKRKNLHEQVYG